MWRPARNPCRRSTSRTASSIALEPELETPCRGKSETITTAGSRTPAASSPQTDPGSSPAFVAPAVLTHAEPAPAASACAAPIGIFVTAFVAGSIRARVPSTKFAAQSAPAP